MLYVGSIKNSEYNPDDWLSGIPGYSSLEKQTAPDAYWSKFLIHSNGNVFAITYPGYIYLQTAGSGSFLPLSTSSLYFTGICEDVITGDVYVTFYDTTASGIYILRVSSDGSVIESIGMDLEGVSDDTYARGWYDIIGTSAGNIYASNTKLGGCLWKLNKTSDLFEIVPDSFMISGRRYKDLMQIDGEIFTTYLDDNSNNQIYPYYQGCFKVTALGLAAVSFSPVVSGVSHYTTINKGKSFNGNIYILFSGIPAYMELNYLYSSSGGLFTGNGDYSLWYVRDIAFHSSGIQIISVGEYNSSYPGALYFRTSDGILFTLENTLKWKTAEFYNADVYAAVSGGGIYRLRAS